MGIYGQRCQVIHRALQKLFSVLSTCNPACGVTWLTQVCVSALAPFLDSALWYRHISYFLFFCELIVSQRLAKSSGVCFSKFDHLLGPGEKIHWLWPQERCCGFQGLFCGEQRAGCLSFFLASLNPSLPFHVVLSSAISPCVLMALLMVLAYQNNSIKDTTQGWEDTPLFWPSELRMNDLGYFFCALRL